MILGIIGILRPVFETTAWFSENGKKSVRIFQSGKMRDFYAPLILALPICYMWHLEIRFIVVFSHFTWILVRATRFHISFSKILFCLKLSKQRIYKVFIRKIENLSVLNFSLCADVSTIFQAHLSKTFSLSFALRWIPAKW